MNKKFAFIRLKKDNGKIYFDVIRIFHRSLIGFSLLKKDEKECRTLQIEYLFVFHKILKICTQRK